MPAKQPAAKKKTKAEKKRLRKAQQSVFCWYCEREFEDAKVLLQHQKAKHFRCPHCPRRLNTAGGLSVHIDQVHKLPSERIENAIPGRDNFDVEIYGMEGVPANDLADWKRRKAESLGLDPNADKRKRPKIFLGVLSAEELKAQLEQHKTLMSGAPAAPPPGAGLPYGVPPPGMLPPGPFPHGVPAPPGMPFPPPGMSLPPPQGMTAAPAGTSAPIPPPGMTLPLPPPGMILPPGMMPPPPPGMPLPFGLPLPPGMIPPPGMVPPGLALPSGLPPPPGMPLPPPGLFPPGLPPPPGMPGSSPLLALTGSSGDTSEAAKPLPANIPVEDSKVTLKPGQVVLYGDNDVSVEEKRARQPRYRSSRPALAV